MGGRFTQSHFDVLACYAVPLNRWWIIPSSAVSGLANVSINVTDGGNGKYHAFAEGWDFLDDGKMPVVMADDVNDVVTFCGE